MTGSAGKEKIVSGLVFAAKLETVGWCSHLVDGIRLVFLTFDGNQYGAKNSRSSTEN